MSDSGRVILMALAVLPLSMMILVAVLAYRRRGKHDRQQKDRLP